MVPERALRRILYDPADDLRFGATPESLQPLPIPWPQGLEPIPVQARAADSDPLPAADVLIVTYTVAEGYALADILTPGIHTSTWTPYRSGWPAIKALIEGGRAPALHSDCAGYWAVTKIGDTTAVLVKSELHPSTDGPKLPIAAAWKQWIAQVQPKFVITTGTAGAVQASTQLGDVIVSRNVRWDCQGQFRSEPFAGAAYQSPVQLDPALFAQAQGLIAPNAARLPALVRNPRIWVDGQTPAHIVTTDFFAFDDASNHYGLRAFDGLARAVEMDDAALATALDGISGAPPWLAIRNASDPQMNEPTLAAESKQADAIYQKYGQTTSWGSAIACWAACVNLGSLV